MAGRLRGSITARMGLALGAQALIAAGLTAAALHWLASPVLGLALALLVCVPVLAWLAQRAARPWRTTIAALGGAIGSLRERDFSVTIATPDIEELRTLVEAYNGLGAVLRRERFDLYQRELLLDTVLQTTPHALVLSNDAGRIVYGNIAARALLNGGSKLEGLEREALLREQPRELRAAVAGSDDTLFTLGTGPESEVYRFSRRTFLLNTRPHQLWLLERLTRELTAQEIAVWKKVIRVIAHELNNSLAPISSLVHSGKLLAQQADPAALGAQFERIFSTIGDRTAHLAVFIDGYARFAKLPRPRPAPVAWSAFIARLAATLEFRIEGTLPERPGNFDAAQLEQVMINLVKNAAESGSDPGEITVSVRERAPGFQIEVADRGAGLTEAALRDALLPFFSTKPSGTGLGLTLCREIIEAHAGRLGIANRPGGGARVSIYLP